MSRNLFSLAGKVALVTGSSQGIGYAIARGLASAGAEIVLNGRDQGKLALAAEALTQAGHKVHTRSFDVTDEKAVDAAIDEIEARIGAIDILVNNAGVQQRAPITEFPTDGWRRVMTTNLDAVFFLCRKVGRGMVARREGKVINICSVTSLIGRATIAPYAASKGAVKMLTQALAAEWGPHNVQVNGIGPGYFVTELNEALLANQEFTTWVEKRTPAGRWAQTEELEGAAIFLASAASSYVNGHLLMVDGGLSAVV